MKKIDYVLELTMQNFIPIPTRSRKLFVKPLIVISIEFTQRTRNTAHELHSSLATRNTWIFDFFDKTEQRIFKLAFNYLVKVT